MVNFSKKITGYEENQYPANTTLNLNKKMQGNLRG
jgi:hypothetical protein